MRKTSAGGSARDGRPASLDPVQARIEAIVADWGPFSTEQRDKLRLLLAPAAQALARRKRGITKEGTGAAA